MDSLDTIIWRPYIDCVPWMDDAWTLPYILQSRYLIGRTTYIVERQLIGHILRQFGIIQHMPIGVTMYA